MNPPPPRSGSGLPAVFLFALIQASHTALGLFCGCSLPLEDLDALRPNTQVLKMKIPPAAGLQAPAAAKKASLGALAASAGRKLLGIGELSKMLGEKPPSKIKVEDFKTCFTNPLFKQRLQSSS